MLAVENNCCWVASLAAAARILEAVFVLQPSSINAKVFRISFHVFCSNNSTDMEVIANHLSAKCKEACWAGQSVQLAQHSVAWRQQTAAYTPSG